MDATRAASLLRNNQGKAPHLRGLRHSYDRVWVGAVFVYVSHEQWVDQRWLAQTWLTCWYTCEHVSREREDIMLEGMTTP